MVDSKKKKVADPGIRQRVLDTLTDEPQTFDVILKRFNLGPIGSGVTPISRELGVLCSEGRAIRQYVLPTAQHTSIVRWVAAPHVLEARRTANLNQRVAALLHEAERADSLWFNGGDISDLAEWAGVPQYFALSPADAVSRRRRIAAWYVLRRALGDAGYRYLALSLATDPEPAKHEAYNNDVDRILRAAKIPVYGCLSGRVGVRTAFTNNIVTLRWASGPDAKDAKWGPETASILNRARAILGDAGYDVEAPVPASAAYLADVVRPAAPQSQRGDRTVIQDPEVMGGAPILSGTRITTESIARFHNAGYAADQIVHNYPTLTVGDVSVAIAYEKSRTKAEQAREWAIGDRVRCTSDGWTGEITGIIAGLFKITQDGHPNISRRASTSMLDKAYTLEPRDAHPPAKIDEAWKAGDLVRRHEIEQPIGALPRQDGKLSPHAGAAYYELLTSGPFGLDRDSEIRARLERAGFKDIDLPAVFEELHEYAGVVYSRGKPTGSERKWMLPREGGAL